MVIGLLTLEIHLHSAQSLKDKRQVLLRVKDRLRHKFNVAVAEVDHQDTWQRATLGVVSVSSSEQNLRQVLDGAEREVESLVEDGSVVGRIELL